MNHLVKQCLCPDEADRLVRRPLSDEEAEAWERHIERCPACAGLLDQRLRGDAMATALRQASGPEGGTPVPGAPELIDRLKKLVSESPTPTPDASSARTPAHDGVASFPAQCQTGAGDSEPAHVGEPASTELWDFLAPAQQPDELGRLGPYRVLHVLGRGGMGVVFRAEDPHLQRPVALKAMLPSLAASPSAKQRFLREARLAASIKHDHIVTIHQVGEDRGAPFLAMEFLEGESLDTRLKRQGKLLVTDVVRIGREMAEGLAAAHERGLIHRDIKPGNVWLEGKRARVKVLDFGLARATADQANLTQSGAIVGTPAFMAPEQAQGKPVDHRCDLYSLGCVLYRMATGVMPFKGEDTFALLTALALETPRPALEVNPSLSPELSRLIDRLLAKYPADRPGSALEVMAALEQIAQEPSRERAQSVEETAVLPPGGLSRVSAAAVVQAAAQPSRSRPLRRLLTAVAASALVAAVALGVWVIIKNQKGEEVGRVPLPEGGSIELRNDANAAPSPPASKPSPFDQLRRADIPADALAVAGGGDPQKAPPQLVAILGESRRAVPPPTEHRHLTAAFSPNGRLLVTTHRGVKPRVWDTATCKVLFSPTSARGGGAAFSPDGRVVAFSDGGRIMLHELPRGNPLRALDTTETPAILQSLAFSPDGKVLAAGNERGQIILCDWASGQLVQTFAAYEASKHPNQLSALAFSPNGKLLATGARAGPVKVWDPGRAKELDVEFPVNNVTHLVFTPDGKALASCSSFGTFYRLMLWDTGTWKSERSWALGRDDGFGGLAVHPDGQLFAASTRSGLLQFWERATGALRESIPVPGAASGNGSAVAYSPEGRYLALANEDDTVYILRLAPPAPK